jgi:hypothetical protein
LICDSLDLAKIDASAIPALLVPKRETAPQIYAWHRLCLCRFWAIQRGEELQPDAFSELTPFTTKETLGVIEFFTSPVRGGEIERLGRGGVDQRGRLPKEKEREGKR